MFDLNQLYIQQLQTISACENPLQNFDRLSKLSLFKMKSATNVLISDDELFASLLLSFESRVYFSKNISNELLYWELFADRTELDIWLSQNVTNSEFDFLLWPHEHFQAPKLVVFDMDSTFIQIEVIDELARQHGVGDSVAKVTEAAMRGEIDFSKSLISRVACLQGLAYSTIDRIANNLPLSLGVDSLVEQSKKNDVKIAIVSGGFTPFVQHLKDTMGLFKVKANDLEIVDGKLTGKVLGSIVDAQAKADFVNWLKHELKISNNEILTIGDGANDLLMMKESGFNLAYRAKPAVQEQASGRMNVTQLDHLLCLFKW